MEYERGGTGRFDERWAATAVFLAFLALGLVLARAPLLEQLRSAPVEEPPLQEERRRLDPAALGAAKSPILAELERKAFPGAAFAFGIGGRIELVEGHGRVGWRERAADVTPDGTMYDLASVTKAVATTLAVLILAEDGVIGLDEPVQRHLPEFEGEHKERITWRHLLTHTSGLPGGAVIRGENPRERARRLLRTRTMGPGKMVTYTDLGFVVLWEAAQRAAGAPLEEFLQQRLFGPLAMENTRFAPGRDCEACAPTLRLSTGETYRGMPNDLLARRLGGVTGNAGLFSTASDMARFAAMIGNGGELDGTRILRPESIAELFRQQPGAGRRALGWVAFCPAEPGGDDAACERPIAFGHTGWAGTSLWMEPGGGAWAVLLTNRSYDVRAEQRMPQLRADLFRALVGRDAGPVLSGREE